MAVSCLPSLKPSGEERLPIIGRTPESDTTSERFFWDRVILALDTISNLSSDVDLFEEIQNIREETRSDALELIFSYGTMITVEPGQSSMLEEVFKIMEDSGLIEPEA